MKTVGLIITIIVLFFIGIMCLFFPEKVQEFQIKSLSWGLGKYIRPSRADRFVKSYQYISHIKGFGYVAILMACFLTWGFIHKYILKLG
jgi:hypothetical protein